MATAGTSAALQLGMDALEAFNAAGWSRYRGLLAPEIVYEETGTGRRLEGGI